MKTIEYIYKQKNVINVIQAKVSQNSKIGIGYIIQTYHFSIDQVKNNDFSMDTNNCLDCPFSFNQNDGKSGGCYTHKGMQLMGLKSMLKRLNKKINTLNDFNESNFNNFVKIIKNTYPVDLVRFGAYGEPVLLGSDVVKKLVNLGKKHTGYTHQYRKNQFNWSNDFFMASTHNLAQSLTAARLGFRSFFVADNSNIDGVNCPASKESNRKSSCIKCGLCNGSLKGSKKDVYILQH